MPKFSCRKISYPSEFISAISLLMKSFVQNQMVNTRRGSDQQGQNNQIPMPLPLTPEQYFQLQMQMIATLNNTVQALQQAHPPPPPRDRRAEFLRGHPPTFSHTSDPLQADDCSVQWSASWTSPSAMIVSASCTQQDSCEGQLWTGGSPTQFRTARLSLGSSSGSGSAATTSPRAL